MGLFEDLSMFNRRQGAVVTAFSKIGYKVVPRKGTPCINRNLKTVYLPVVDPDKYPDVTRTIRGWTDHEMAHELYKSDHEVLKKAIAKGKKFENIFRYIEDGRVERLESRDFEGCRENLTYLEQTTLVDRKKMGLTLYLAGKYGIEGVKLYKMDEWGAILGADIVQKCSQIETCEDAYDVAQEAFKRIQKYIESAIDSEGTEEGSEEDTEKHPSVGKDSGKKEEEKGPEKEQDEILQEDKPEPKESEDEEDKSESGKDNGDDTSDGKEPDGDSGDTDNPEGSHEEESDEVQRDKDDSESTDGTEESEPVSEEDKEEETPDRDSGDTDNPEETPSESSDDVPDGTEESEPVSEEDKEERNSKIENKLDELIDDTDLMEGLLEKLKEDLSDIPEDPRAYTPYTANDKVHDLTRDLERFPSRGWFPTLIEDARGKVSALATKLRLELFATKMLFERYKDRGSLDQRRLHVLGMGTTTDVFMKRTVKPELDTAISLLVDASGSMGERGKIVLAAQVAYLLSSTLETINVPNEVLSFTDSPESGYMGSGYDYDRIDSLEHFIHKSFSSRLKHCTEAMNRIGCQMRNNTDGESVLWAAARLATRREKRKVLFVLSDGQPASNADFNKLRSHLKEVVQMVSKHGIECVGIGILTDCVKEFYPHNVVVHNINDLVTTVYGELVKAIRGAKKGVAR